jgi:protein CpxP
MRSTFRLLAGVAALSAAAGLATATFAQEPPPGGPPPAPMAGHPEWAAKMHEHMHERALAKAKALHDILNITPDQETAFQAFITSMKPPEGHGPMDGHHEHGDEAALTTPERLDKMAARMAEHQAAFQRRADAIRHFYAALSPAQQRAFDAMHGVMGGHHGRGGGHGWGGEGRMGPPHEQG